MKRVHSRRCVCCLLRLVFHLFTAVILNFNMNFDISIYLTWHNEARLQLAHFYSVISWCRFLPMQFPRASWIKPAPHLTLGRQRNDPWVFWHTNPGPQLWKPVSHSSISAWSNYTEFPEYLQKLKNIHKIFKFTELRCSNVTDPCNCCCPWVHSQSHSWPLSDNGMSPLCWYSALLPDSC